MACEFLKRGDSRPGLLNYNHAPTTRGHSAFSSHGVAPPPLAAARHRAAAALWTSAAQLHTRIRRSGISGAARFILDGPIRVVFGRCRRAQDLCKERADPHHSFMSDGADGAPSSSAANSSSAAGSRRYQTFICIRLYLSANSVSAGLSTRVAPPCPYGPREFGGGILNANWPELKGSLPEPGGLCHL